MRERDLRGDPETKREKQTGAQPDGKTPMEYREGIIKTTEFFTTTELAEKLKMNVQVVTRKVQAGEIAAYKIGKEWRIPEQAVYEWLQARSNRSGRRTRLTQNAQPDRQPEERPVADRRSSLLEYILAQFEPERLYTEAEIDGVIRRYHRDCDSIRRDFLNLRMLERVNGHYKRPQGYRLIG